MNFVSKLIRVYLLFNINNEISKRIKKNEKIFVNIGCGSDIREGWINIDEVGKEFLNENLTKSQKNSIFQYNCSNGLRMKQNSVDFIYSSHFFEHLTPSQGLKLFSHCHKALKKGGVFKIVLPNVYNYLEKYFCSPIGFSYDDKTELTTERTMFRLENYENDIDYLNYLIFQNGEHKLIYTPEKVIQILKYVGFKTVKETEFDKNFDIESRKKSSFYLQAIK